MRPAFRSLKMWSPLDSRLIRRHKDRVDKAKKHQDHQTHVLLGNARTAFKNQMRTSKIHVDCSTSTDVSKLQKEVKRLRLFVFIIMVKAF